MKILIIGGTGNISTPLTQTLLGQGHDLTLFNYDPQPPAWFTPGQVVTGDRTNRADFEQKLAGLGTFDCVIDMICYEPADAECDVRVFRGRTKQFLFCSTVDVYSKTPASYPVSEATAQLGARPSFPYGHKKMVCEQLLWEAHARGDFGLTVIRPTFTYNETWSPGIHSFGGQTYHLDRLRQGKPIILHGDGTSLWVATYRDDTARAFVGAVGNERALGQAYHLAPDEWMTHNHIWRTIARVLEAPPPDFVYIPTELLGKMAPRQAEWCVENFQHHNVFDSTKAARDLGYRYTIRFEAGVRKCLGYLQAHNLIEDCANHPFYDRLVDAWRTSETALIDRFKADPLV